MKNLPSRTQEALGSQAGLSFLTVLLFVVFIGAIAGAAALAVFVANQSDGSEETAKYMPADTQIYFSLDLEPGADQLLKFRQIVERFQRHPEFQRALDDLVEMNKEETGLDFNEDIRPWVAGEIALGVVDLLGSAVALEIGGPPLIVGIAGVKDPDAASDALSKWISSLEIEALQHFESDEYRAVTIYGDKQQFEHYALTEKHLVFATDRKLLEETLDLIIEPRVFDSLYSQPRFIEARANFPDPRFASLFVDAEAILLDAQRQFGAQLPPSIKAQLESYDFRWMALTGSLLERGLQLTFTMNQAADAGLTQFTLVKNSAAAASLLPANTYAFLSFKIDPDLTRLREELGQQQLGKLDPTLPWVFTDLFGRNFSSEDTFADVLDASLDLIEDTVGLDLENEVLLWMTGEVALALLPTDFPAVTRNPMNNAVELAALIQFQPGSETAIQEAVDQVFQFALEMGLGSRKVNIAGRDGRVLHAGIFGDLGAYAPGFVTLNDHLLFGTTINTMEEIAATEDSPAGSLGRDPEYSRLRNHTTGANNPIIYISLKEFREASVSSLEGEDLRTYQREVEPWTEPLQAMMVVGESTADVRRGSAILTVDNGNQ